jgi:hypothetical protein
MALHFCKYTGQFAEVRASGDMQLRSRSITDSFIISLCSANALNINLARHFGTDIGYESATLRDIGLHLSEKLYPSTKFDDDWLLVTHATLAGKMARACEKIDHRETLSNADMAEGLTPAA